MGFWNEVYGAEADRLLEENERLKARIERLEELNAKLVEQIEDLKSQLRLRGYGQS